MILKRTILFSLLILFFIPSVQAAWYDQTYLYRVNNIMSDGARPIQLELNLSNSSGTNNATTIFTNGNSNLNFSDVIFTLDNTTVLPFYLEQIGTSWKVYVNLTVNGTVNMYYSKPSATSLSDPNTTFAFFDNFENGNTNKWWKSSGVNFGIANGSPMSGTYYGRYNSTNTSGIAKSLEFNVINPTVEFDIRTTSIAGNSGFLTRTISNNGSVSATDISDAVFRNNQFTWAWGANNLYGSPSINTIYKFKVFSNTISNTFNIYVDNTLQKSGATYSGSGATAKAVFIAYDDASSVQIDIDNVKVYTNYNNQTWQTWSSQQTFPITSWNNNYTNDNTLNFSKLISVSVVNFSITSNATGISWFVDGVNQSTSNKYLNYAISQNQTYNITVIVTNPDTQSISWYATGITYPFTIISPSNGSTTSSSSVTLTVREWTRNDSYNYYIATDAQFINNVSSGMLVCSNELCSDTVSLSSSTTYFWYVKNGINVVTPVSNFTTPAASVVPGRFNISVFDEINTSYRILNYSVTLIGANTAYLIKNSNITNGWTNFSGTEVIEQEYLIVVTSNGWSQRMVLNNSPANVTVYMPNSSLNTIDVVSFTLLDVTGLYPFQTSKLFTLKGGAVMDSSYFSADASHVINMIRGQNYGIRVTNGNNIFEFQNYNSVGSGSVTISINDFKVYPNIQMPFVYNISYNPSTIELQWNDSNNAMESINFSVRRNTSIIQCSLVTTVNTGQSVCLINTQSLYTVIFSAKMNDGTFKNMSFSIDYRNVGKVPDSTGTSRIDGTLIGTGYKVTYQNQDSSLGLGSYTIPQDIKNLVSLLLIIILAAEFGAAYAGLGGVLIAIMALFFEYYGLFRPYDNDTSQYALMALTGGIAFMAMLYYFQHKDKYG